MSSGIYSENIRTIKFLYEFGRLIFSMPQSRGIEKEGPMDRNDLIEDGIEELGVASVETLGQISNNPETEGVQLFLGGGISAE